MWHISKFLHQILTNVHVFLSSQPHCKKKPGTLKNRLYTDPQMLTALDRRKCGKTFRESVEGTNIALSSLYHK